VKKEEKLLVEAIRGYMKDPERMGLGYHKPPHEKRESSHFFWYQWEGIDDRFAILVSESKYQDSLTAAFYSTHSYKYVNDPTFKLSLDSDLRSMGVPKNDREMAGKAVDTIIKEIKQTGEKDAGWNPKMNELVDATSNADIKGAKPSMAFTDGGPYPQPVTRGKDEPHAEIPGQERLKDLN